MKQDIYLDVYFSFNFLMDFFVLLLTRMLLQNQKSLLRLNPAAGVGALYATVVLVGNFNGIGIRLVTYLAVAEIMLRISFGKANLRESVRRFCILYGVTFASNGMINGIYYGTRRGKNLIELANQEPFGSVSLLMILCIMIPVGTVVPVLFCRIRADIRLSRKIYDVTLGIEGKTIHVRALCDTGNSLVEPVTKKPVSVIEKDCLKSVEPCGMKYLLIPYHTVGEENGLMQAFVADCMETEGKVVENAVVGIHEGKLSVNGNYEMILHPDIIMFFNCNCFVFISYR